MQTFGKALKAARKSKRATLREVGDAINKSIPYINDMEQGRCRPPKLEDVEIMELILGITDKSLYNLAKIERSECSPELAKILIKAEETAKKVKNSEKFYEEVLEAIEKVYKSMQCNNYACAA